MHFSDEQVLTHIRNGDARIEKDGMPIDSDLVTMDMVASPEYTVRVSWMLLAKLHKEGTDASDNP